MKFLIITITEWSLLGCVCVCGKVGCLLCCICGGDGGEVSCGSLGGSSEVLYARVVVVMR